MHPAEAAVDEGHDGDERDQHGDHVQHEVQPLGGAPGCRVHDVYVGPGDVELQAPQRFGHLGLRLQELGHHDRSRRRHDDGRQEVPRLDPERDIRRHDGAGDVRHAGGHHRHQLRPRHLVEEWPDGERRLRLAHEDGRRDVKALRTTGLEELVHGDRHRLHHDLHDAEVVHDGEQRGDEDDRR